MESFSNHFYFAIDLVNSSNFFKSTLIIKSLSFEFLKIYRIIGDTLIVEVSVSSLHDAFWLGKLAERHAKL